MATTATCEPTAITSRPSPSGHLGPSGDRTPVILAPDGTAPLAETWPPGTWQLGSSHLPPLCGGVQAGADRQSDSRRRLNAVCVCVHVC